MTGGVPGVGAGAVVWTVVVLLVAPALFRVLRVDRHPLAVWSLSFTPWLAGVAAVAAVAAVALLEVRRPWAAAVLAGVAGAYAVWTWADVGRGDGRRLPAEERALTLVTANLSDSNERPEDLARALLGLDADVLVLQEVTPPHAAAFDAVGLHDVYAHGLVDVRDDEFGSAVLARTPVVAAERLRYADRPTTSAVVTTVRGGERVEVRVVNAHPRAPVSLADQRRWHAQFADLAAVVTRESAHESRPLVVAGDWNATGFHRPLRDLVAAGGLRDAHVVAGRGLGFTWPVDRWWMPPVLRLDRIHVGPGLRAGAPEPVTLPGTDHRALRVDLAPGS